MGIQGASLADQGFYLQAPGIWIRRPRPCPTSVSTLSQHEPVQNSPSLILLFSWTGASARPISKYTSSYIAMVPNTPIMLITTALSDLTVHSSHRKQFALAPAVAYICLHHLDTKLHIHAFSDGGSHKAIQLATAYVSTTGRKLPVNSLCLDSTPAAPQFQRVARAFTLSFPPNPPFLRQFGRILAYLLLTCLWCFYLTCGYDKNIITQIRHGLDDQRLWDTRRGPRRCYLYSQGDELIDWQDVERHAEEAEKAGVEILRVRFGQSEHCAHIKEDMLRYWSGVRWTLRLDQLETCAMPGEKYLEHVIEGEAVEDVDDHEGKKGEEQERPRRLNANLLLQQPT